MLCHGTICGYLRISARQKATSRSGFGRWRGFFARVFFSFIFYGGQRRILSKISAAQNAMQLLRLRRNRNSRRKSPNPLPKNSPKKFIISWKKRKNGKARNTPNRKNFGLSDFEPFPQTALPKDFRELCRRHFRRHRRLRSVIFYML